MTTSTILSDNGVSSGSSGLKTSGGNDGTLVLQTTTSGGTATTAVTIDTAQNATFANAANLPNTFGFKNRLINGGMVIAQYGTSNTTASGFQCVDRWRYNQSQSNKGTWNQNFGAATPPAGFSNYLGFQTGGSSYSVLTGDYFFFDQVVEGFNIADFAWGTANAKAATLSFWVLSSLTGTFGGAIRNTTSGGLSYPFTYTISAANTWTYVTVAIAAPTTGSFATNNTAGLNVCFGLGVGSTYSGAAGSWSANNYVSATGATSVVGTSSATWFVTGVQLEKGTQATSFDFRSYGTELALCQRYYQSWGGDSTYDLVAVGQAYGSTQACVLVTLQQKMRANPTLGYSAVGNFMLTGAGNTINAVTGLSLDMSATQTYSLNVTVGSGLTGGNATRLHANGTTSARLTMSAEL